MRNKEKIILALENGATNCQQIYNETGISKRQIYLMINRLKRGGNNLYGYKIHNTGKPICESVKKILSCRKRFIKECGFPPKFAWIAKKTGYSLEYISQTVLGINVKNNATIKRSIKLLYIHKDFDKMIQSLADKYDVNFYVGLKIYSYQWAEYNEIVDE